MTSSLTERLRNDLAPRLANDLPLGTASFVALVKDATDRIEELERKAQRDAAVLEGLLSDGAVEAASESFEQHPATTGEFPESAMQEAIQAALKHAARRGEYMTSDNIKPGDRVSVSGADSQYHGERGVVVEPPRGLSDKRKREVREDFGPGCWVAVDGLKGLRYFGFGTLRHVQGSETNA